MTYKSIVVHVDHSDACRQRVALAIELAQSQQAHLTGVVPTGVIYYPYGGGGYGGGGNAMGIYYEAATTELREVAQQSVDSFKRQVAQAGLPSAECRIANEDAITALTLHGHYADLVVLSQSNPDIRGIAANAVLPQHVLLHVARPVLLVPYAGTFSHIGQQVMVAWDSGRESARAVADALPILKLAAKVHVIVFNGKKGAPDGHGPHPGTEIALYLSRHGVNVEASEEETSIDIGSALLSRMSDYGSDMLVMGGYGHSRFRETILGGITRTILEHMTVPVLMSH